MSQGGANSSSGSGASPIQTLTGNSGGPVGPDPSYNINVVGNNGVGIDVVGNAGANTLTIRGLQSSTTQFGVVKLATNAQAIAGTDTNNAITSSALTAKLGTQTANGLPIGAGSSSALSWTAAPTNGQILIGGTGVSPSLNTLTAGSGISITNASNSITIAATGAGEVSQINGDSGSATPSGGAITFNANSNSGASVVFAASGSTVNLKVTDTNDNTLIGLGAGNGTLSGTNNTALGNNALLNATSASSNVAIGANALLSSTSAGENVAIGYDCGRSITTGQDNTIIGRVGGSAAGSNYTSSESSNILLNNVGVTGESHIIRIGTQGSSLGQQNACFIAGIEGVSVSNKNIVTINTSTGQLGSDATVAVAQGGTGATSLTAHGVLLGQGSSAITATAVGATGTVLAGNTGADPTFQTIAGLGGITTITGNSGGAESPSAGNFNILGTGSITVAGSANTETVQLTGLTNHNVLVGAGTATITNVAPSATSGVPLISQGASADPTFGTAVVAGGGTGATTLTGVLLGNGTSAISGLTGNSKVIASNSSGTFAARGFSVVIQTFTAGGTYTPTSGMLYCIIECVGGGGAGGGAAATAGGTTSCGAGGGSGEYAAGVFSAATIGASQTVTIGAAGAGSSGTTGGNGGNTSVGALISANGGTGGPTPAASANTQAAGGAGGTGGSGGSVRFPGQPGFPAFSSISPGFVQSGPGGSSRFGSGGSAQITAASGGNAGTGNGSGGSGAANYTSGAAQTGGAGTVGIVVVTEYVIA